MFLRRLLNLPVIILALAVILNCSAQKTEKHTLTQAYELLDKGQNSEAISLLEAYLIENPENQEALVLLSSAYLGAAGLDIYAAYGTFKDLIFDQSLGDSFFRKPKIAKEPNPASPKTQAPIERFLYGLDFFLTQLRNTVHFLDRFPHVEQKQWPLLDEALTQLNQTEPSKELATYRVFLRIVYMKSYLDVEWVRNEEVGTHDWLCTLQFLDLRDKILWLVDHMDAGLTDMNRIYPTKTKDWAAAQKRMVEIRDWLESDAPGGTYTVLISAEGKLREELQCALPTSR